MKKLSIIILAVMLGLLLAPLVALAQAPVERLGPVAPVSEAEGMGMPEEPEGASTSAMSLLADSGSGALQAGADQLAAMQAWDGGWGWPLNPPDEPKASPRNTIGPIGMGLAQAYGYTQDSDHLAALEGAGQLLLTKINNFSPPDGYLAAQLDAVFGVTTYTDHVLDKFYGPLSQGTYDRNGAGVLYTTEAYVESIDIARASYGALGAWDIGMGLAGAKAAGVTGDDLGDWIDGTKAEVEQITLGSDYDVLGLAGALYGLAYAEAEFDPTAGAFAGADSLGDLADILASYQLDTGGFAWSSAALAEGEGNESIQETAYAVLALNQVNRDEYLDHVRKAAAYMVSVQLESGGWEGYTGGGENNEITGEALWALAVAQPILWVDAPEHTDAQGKAVVRVMLDPIIDVFGLEFTLTYSPASLDLDPDGVVPGGALDALADEDEAGGYSWDVAIDETAGTIKIWVSLLDNVAGDLPGLTAQSELVRVSFTATGTCGTSSPLEISDEVLTRKLDGEQILPVTTMGDSIIAYGLVPVSGVVQLQGRESGNWDSAKVTLTSDPFIYPDIATNGAGEWSQEVACGTYHVYVDMNAYLDAEKPQLGEAISEYDAGMVKLLGGNADETAETSENEIELADVVAIARVIGQAVDMTEDWFNHPFYPDINADGTINILDLVLAGINYTEEGPKGF